MKYKIIDGQGGGLKQDEVFDSLEEVRDELRDFHSADNDTDKWSLIDCIEIGCWDVVAAETGLSIEDITI